MKSRILLINFSERDLNRLDKLNLQIDRGYISDVTSSTTSPKTGKDEFVKYYFPHPVYEYRVVVANLNSHKEINEEFKNKALSMPRSKRGEFFEFWQKRGILIVFLGDYKYSNLINLGVLGLNLKAVDSQDITCNFVLSDKTPFRKSFKNSCPQVNMPTNKYIDIDDKIFTSFKDQTLRGIFLNSGDCILGCYLNNRAEYYDEDDPLYVILPQFRDNILLIEKLLKELAKLRTKFLPELVESEWVESDKYYPNEVYFFDKEIEKTIEKAKKDIAELSDNKDKRKDRYAYLRGILFKQGNELKQDIIQLLREVFKLDIIDADEQKTGDLAEDIIIDTNGKKILAEIKGTVSQNPSPLFITQIWKHVHMSKDKDVVEGCLIINYDINTDPEDRSLAYIGEYEKGLEDIIFIDTRVMFYLGIAIIDYGLSSVDAAKILLRKGRVEFNLEEYLKNKGKSGGVP